MIETTPDFIGSLAPNEIFVFGSNYAGIHGAGAALYAKRNFRAVQGEGIGPTGQCYAIATKDQNINTFSLGRIATQVETFLIYAAQRPATRFLVTPIGCGLAGYKPRDIAPFFRNASPNVILPKSFVEILKTAPGPQPA